MTESIYNQYFNKYYNPNDNDKRPGDNDNWKSIQKGFHDISTTQLETSAGLTLGKGTEDETNLSAGELKEIKNPSQLETSGGLTLGKGTEHETNLSAGELKEIKNPSQLGTSGGLTLGKDTEDETSVTAAELQQMKNAGNIDHRMFVGTATHISFTEGYNYLTVNNMSMLFPAQRLNGFQPNTRYNLSGTWTAGDMSKFAFGVVIAFAVTANNNGELDFSEFEIIGMSNDSLTSTVTNIVLHVTALH